MALSEITVIDAPLQRLEVYLSGVAVALTLWWNETSERWSLSLEIDGQPRLEGRRLVPGVDLFRGYGLGIGRLFLVDWTLAGGGPDRNALPAGDWRLIHDDAA